MRLAGQGLVAALVNRDWRDSTSTGSRLSIGSNSPVYRCGILGVNKQPIQAELEGFVPLEAETRGFEGAAGIAEREPIMLRKGQGGPVRA